MEGAEDVHKATKVGRCLGQGGLAFDLGAEVIGFKMWGLVGAE